MSLVLHSQYSFLSIYDKRPSFNLCFWTLMKCCRWSSYEPHLSAIDLGKSPRVACIFDDLASEGHIL